VAIRGAVPATTSAYLEDVVPVPASFVVQVAAVPAPASVSLEDAVLKPALSASRAAAFPQAQSVVGIQPANADTTAFRPAPVDPPAVKKDMVPVAEVIAALWILTVVPLLADAKGMRHHTPRGELQQLSL
jgi:hypothetical protein